MQIDLFNIIQEYEDYYELRFQARLPNHLPPSQHRIKLCLDPTIVNQLRVAVIRTRPEEEAYVWSWHSLAQRKPKLTRKIAGGEGSRASSLPTISKQGSKKRFGSTHNSDDSAQPDEGSSRLGKSGSHSARNPSPGRPPLSGRSNSASACHLSTCTASASSTPTSLSPASNVYACSPPTPLPPKTLCARLFHPP